MSVLNFKRKLKEIADVNENRDIPVNYFEAFNKISVLKFQALEYAWRIITTIFKEESKKSEGFSVYGKYVPDICLEQLVWIIEHKGNGVTSYKHNVVKEEKEIYSSFNKIMERKDIDYFIEAVIKYYFIWHCPIVLQKEMFEKYKIENINIKFKNEWNKIARKK